MGRTKRFTGTPFSTFAARACGARRPSRRRRSPFRSVAAPALLASTYPGAQVRSTEREQGVVWSEDGRRRAEAGGMGMLPPMTPDAAAPARTCACRRRPRRRLRRRCSAARTDGRAAGGRSARPSTSHTTTASGDGRGATTGASSKGSRSNGVPVGALVADHPAQAGGVQRGVRGLRAAARRRVRPARRRRLLADAGHRAQPRQGRGGRPQRPGGARRGP